jgi:uncharacterized SAM-binding protein YcdF (DUF218 family)
MIRAGEGTVAGRSPVPARAVSVRRRRRVAVGLAAALAAATLASLLWRPVLQALGAALVAEDGLAHADLLVISNSAAVPDAMEAAALYRAGIAARVLLPGTLPEPRLATLRALGIPQLGAAELVRAVLERGGVPPAAIETLPDTVDGTGTETAVIAAFAQHHGIERLLVITARTHSARTGWRLRRLLPAAGAVAVRSPRDDRFDPDTWWRSRDNTREVVFEYMRWINSLVGDLWSAPAIREGSHDA